MTHDAQRYYSLQIRPVKWYQLSGVSNKNYDWNIQHILRAEVCGRNNITGTNFLLYNYDSKSLYYVRYVTNISEMWLSVYEYLQNLK